MKTDNKTRILLIGLDGASWQVILPLIKQGKLPNIKGLMDKGSYGSLETLRPTASPAIWTSIATGKIPDKHGITDFLITSPDSNEEVLATSNLRRTKAIWNILSEYQKSVAVIGYLTSWPPEKVRGIMISDRFNNLESIEYYSSKRYDFFTQEELGRFRKLDKNIIPLKHHWVERQDRFKEAAALRLMEKQDFDFLTLYLRGIDIASHTFWDCMEPKSFDVSQEDIHKYGNVIKDYYIYCDGVIGRLLQRIDRDTIVLVVSDHGFASDYDAKNQFSFTNMDFLLQIARLDRIYKNSKVARVYEGATNKTWSPKTKFICIDSNGLTSGEFNEAREHLKKSLLNIKTEKTQTPIFTFKADTKKGFAVTVNIKNSVAQNILINNKKYAFKYFLQNFPRGGHSWAPAGIIIISGENIKRNQQIYKRNQLLHRSLAHLKKSHGRIYNSLNWILKKSSLINEATVLDITPTILHLMGFPIAKDMDGKVLTQAIIPEYLLQNPIRYIDSYGNRDTEKIKAAAPSTLEEEERIKERLRSLGYIS